jgi:hypothetical protein
MLYFWLFVGIAIILGVTYMGFMYGFELWGYYYILGVMAILMFFLRRFMMRRYEKHMQWLEEQKKNENG